MKMKAPSFVKTVSTKLSNSRRSASRAVAPLPEPSRFSEEVTARLDRVKSMDQECGISSSWLVGILDATIDSQIIAHESLNSQNLTGLSDTSREMIDNYLEDNVDLLDACNGLVEKMSTIQKYIDSLISTVHVRPVDTVRNNELLRTECRGLEQECSTLDKRSPKLNKLVGQKTSNLMNNDKQESELHEILSGSKEIASMGCHVMQRALSFKSRKGDMKMRSRLPTTWSGSLNGMQDSMNENVEKRGKKWMMRELEEMVMEAKMGKVNIILLEELESGIVVLEDRVNELYKHLISIRMTLLGIMSQN